MRARVVLPVAVLVVLAGAAVGVLLATVVGDAPAGDAPSPGPAAPAVAPLTGEDVAAVSDRAVLAVKVENSAAARPQTGLEKADIVFEELTEGGITRFVALYHSALPEVVGPVRSARFVDAEILPAYDPVFAISGAAAPVLDELDAAGLVVVDEGDGYFRDPERSAPHNLYLRPEEVLARVDGAAPPSAPVWPFAAETPPGGGVGDQLVVAMSDASVTGWVYERESGLYRRQQDGIPFTVTGADRVGAANVVVLGVETARIPGQDASGQPLVGTDVVGGGQAIVLRDGRRYDSRWAKPSPSAHLELTTPEGDPLPLRPGTTWVMLAPVDRLPAPAPSQASPASPPPQR